MKGFIGAVTFAFVLFCTIVCCAICIEKIPVGYEGVVYSMNGGVQEQTLKQGWHLVSPTKHVKEFTVSNEQLVLSKDKRDGSEEDDSFSVSTADNANIDISFQMTYKFIPEKIVSTYKNFKGMDGSDIVNQRVKTVLKSKISEVTTNHTMMDIYSGDRATINHKITEYLNEEFGNAYGIHVIDASIIDVHPDAKLQETIDNRVTAMQKKQQAEAEQETIKVQNNTKILQAKADAEAKKIAAEGEAEANRIISESLTDEVLKQMYYEKWNGVLPNTIAGNSTGVMITN